jgi:hypothetical protein
VVQDGAVCLPIEIEVSMVDQVDGGSLVSCGLHHQCQLVVLIQRVGRGCLDGSREFLHVKSTALLGPPNEGIASLRILAKKLCAVVRCHRLGSNLLCQVVDGWGNWQTGRFPPERVCHVNRAFQPCGAPCRFDSASNGTKRTGARFKCMFTSLSHSNSTFACQTDPGDSLNIAAVSTHVLEGVGTVWLLEEHKQRALPNMLAFPALS